MCYGRHKIKFREWSGESCGEVAERLRRSCGEKLDGDGRSVFFRRHGYKRYGGKCGRHPAAAVIRARLSARLGREFYIHILRAEPGFSGETPPRASYGAPEGTCAPPPVGCSMFQQHLARYTRLFQLLQLPAGLLRTTSVFLQLSVVLFAQVPIEAKCETISISQSTWFTSQPSCIPSTMSGNVAKSSSTTKTSKYVYRSSGGNAADVSIEYSTDLTALTRLEVRFNQHPTNTSNSTISIPFSLILFDSLWFSLILSCLFLSGLSWIFFHFFHFLSCL